MFVQFPELPVVAIPKGKADNGSEDCNFQQHNNKAND